MARPKLQTVKGKRVKEWTVKRAELELLHKTRAPKAVRIKVKALRIPKAQLRIPPETFLPRDLRIPEYQ